MKHLLLLFAAIVFALQSEAQTIVNGSFENNTGTCLTNIANATYNTSMQNSVAFGTASQIDILNNTCGFGSAQSGTWFLGLATDITGTTTDAFSLTLSAPLVIGNSYTLTYYDKKDAGYATNPVELGISTSASSFGTQIFVSPTPVVGWTLHSVNFTATLPATYITVHVVGNAYSWTHIDNFSLSANTTSTAQFVDSCFTSASVGTSFNGSNDLGNANGDADLLQWTGSSWTGAWPGANLTIAPPVNAGGCRAIFMGNSVSWTTGGESFGVRLNQPLVTGQTYSFTFTYVSHGLGSDGAFAPYIYTNNGSSMAGVYSMGQLPAVGYTWTTNTFTFIASASQAGHNWIIIGTVPDGSSGIMMGFCASCNVQQPPSNLQTTAAVNFATCFGVCNGDATATPTGGVPPYHYVWSFTNDTTATTDSLCAGGVYYVTVTDALGSSVVDSVFLPVVDPFPVNISSNASAFCAGDTTSVCAPSGFVTYDWSTGETSACIVVNQPGNYDVTVTNVNNCVVASNQISITVYPNPTDSISASQNIFCASDSAQICSPSGFVSYLWNTGQTSNCIYATHAGNYYVTVTDANNCTASSNHLPVFVYPLPPVSVSVNGDTLRAFNAVSYKWYFNNNIIGGATDSVYIATQSGNYTVEITDTNGCHVSSNAVNVTVSGLKEIGEEQFSVYPNPNSEGVWQLHVDESWLNNKVEIFDAEGRLVFQSSIFNFQSSIVLDVARGIYLFRIFNKEKNATVKLVKW